MFSPEARYPAHTAAAHQPPRASASPSASRASSTGTAAFSPNPDDYGPSFPPAFSEDSHAAGSGAGGSMSHVDGGGAETTSFLHHERECDDAASSFGRGAKYGFASGEQQRDHRASSSRSPSPSQMHSLEQSDEAALRSRVRSTPAYVPSSMSALTSTHAPSPKKNAPNSARTHCRLYAATSTAGAVVGPEDHSREHSSREPVRETVDPPLSAPTTGTGFQHHRDGAASVEQAEEFLRKQRAAFGVDVAAPTHSLPLAPPSVPSSVDNGARRAASPPPAGFTALGGGNHVAAPPLTTTSTTTVSKQRRPRSVRWSIESDETLQHRAVHEGSTSLDRTESSQPRGESSQSRERSREPSQALEELDKTIAEYFPDLVDKVGQGSTSSTAVGGSSSRVSLPQRPQRSEVRDGVKLTSWGAPSASSLSIPRRSVTPTPPPHPAASSAPVVSSSSLQELHAVGLRNEHHHQHQGHQHNGATPTPPEPTVKTIVLKNRPRPPPEALAKIAVKMTVTKLLSAFSQWLRFTARRRHILAALQRLRRNGNYLHAKRSFIRWALFLRRQRQIVVVGELEKRAVYAECRARFEKWLRFTVRRAARPMVLTEALPLIRGEALDRLLSSTIRKWRTFALQTARRRVAVHQLDQKVAIWRARGALSRWKKWIYRGKQEVVVSQLALQAVLGHAGHRFRHWLVFAVRRATARHCAINASTDTARRFFQFWSKSTVRKRSKTKDMCRAIAADFGRRVFFKWIRFVMRRVKAAEVEQRSMVSLRMRYWRKWVKFDFWRRQIHAMDAVTAPRGLLVASASQGKLHATYANNSGRTLPSVTTAQTKYARLLPEVNASSGNTMGSRGFGVAAMNASVIDAAEDTSRSASCDTATPPEPDAAHSDHHHHHSAASSAATATASAATNSPTVGENPWAQLRRRSASQSSTVDTHLTAPASLPGGLGGAPLISSPSASCAPGSGGDASGVYGLQNSTVRAAMAQGAAVRSIATQQAKENRTTKPLHDVKPSPTTLDPRNAAGHCDRSGRSGRSGQSAANNRGAMEDFSATHTPSKILAESGVGPAQLESLQELSRRLTAPDALKTSKKTDNQQVSNPHPFTSKSVLTDRSINMMSTAKPVAAASAKNADELLTSPPGRTIAGLVGARASSLAPIVMSPIVSYTPPPASPRPAAVNALLSETGLRVSRADPVGGAKHETAVHYSVKENSSDVRDDGAGGGAGVVCCRSASTGAEATALMTAWETARARSESQQVIPTEEGDAMSRWKEEFLSASTSRPLVSNELGQTSRGGEGLDGVSAPSGDLKTEAGTASSPLPRSIQTSSSSPVPGVAEKRAEIGGGYSPSAFLTVPPAFMDPTSFW